MQPRSPEYLELIEVLTDHDVEFIVVGGVCAILHGALLATFDLDIVHACTEENAKRLSLAMQELDAHSRQHQKKVRPNQSHLMSKGHILLNTRLGALDILGTIGAGHDFSDLRKNALQVSIDDLQFLMLDLETLILTKEEAGRPKDLVGLPILKAALGEAKDSEP